MRKVELRMKEEEKYEVIKKLVDSNGNKKTAAIKLECSIRTINRLIIRYKTLGKKGFIHGNRDRIPSTAFPRDTKQLVIDLYNTKYHGANFTHFVELLHLHENIKISDTTIHHWLFNQNVLSPKATRRKQKKLKLKLTEEKEATSSKKKQRQLIEAIESIDARDAHPRHPRSAYQGEIIQMDASEFYWFGGLYTHLHVAIDDASGQIVGAYFDYQETLKGYFNVLHQILKNHGIPVKFKVDRRTVFEYKKKDAPSDSEDTSTQFSYACKQLGIAIEASSIPQTKGRVERLNQTLQSRLPIELRLANVTTIEEANQFLSHYVKNFNQQFALPLNITKNAYEAQPSNEQINQTLAVIQKRVIDSGHAIKYQNQYYLPNDMNGKPVYFDAKTHALVITCFDGTLFTNINDQLFHLALIPDHYKYSKELDFVEEEKPKKKYIPPMTHPWKQASFNAYLRKQKHRPEYKEAPIL